MYSFNKSSPGTQWQKSKKQSISHVDPRKVLVMVSFLMSCPLFTMVCFEMTLSSSRSSLESFVHSRVMFVFNSCPYVNSLEVSPLTVWISHFHHAHPITIRFASGTIRFGALVIRKKQKKHLWWGFQTFFIFFPIPGEMIQFDQQMFQAGWNHQLVYFGPIFLVKFFFHVGGLGKQGTGIL